MQRDDYIAAVRTHGTRLADGADQAGLDAPVPSCPGWDVTRLVRHTARVCQSWNALASRAIDDPSDFVADPEPDPDAIVSAFRTDVETLAATLAPLDPSEPCWTFIEPHDIGFIQRRCAHELAIHAWDAELAANGPSPIDAPLAADGVDEVLDRFVPGRAPHGDGPTLTGHLHATDTDGEWFVSMGPNGWVLDRSHAKGDVAIRGTASDLDLLVWGRSEVGDGRFETFGEPDVIAEFIRRISWQ